MAKTKADVLLKVSSEDFIMELFRYVPLKEYMKKTDQFDILGTIKMFLEERAIPEPSNDERIILKNLGDGFEKICRTESGVLYIKKGETVFNLNQFKDHLFKFIKDGEEYSIKELLEW